MQAHQMSFSKLINVDQGAREHFHVPKYQREYTWKQAQWEQLLNDIEDNDGGYFVGTIICVNESDTLPSGAEILYQVVDGQQRLTTLSLLLATIHARLLQLLNEEPPDDEDDLTELKSAISNIRAKLVKRKKDPLPNEPGSFQIGRHTYFLRVQPSGQNHNLEDYRYLLGQAGVLDQQTKAQYHGNRILARAYGFFEKQIPLDLQGLLGLLEKINQLLFVQITVGSQADAFTLFESLNNRGVPLSAMDIIKNKMLAQMERKHEVSVDESFERWQRLIEALPELGVQERFLRHFYNAFKHRPEIKVERASRVFRSQIIRVYETLIERDAPLLFDELESCSEVYGDLIQANYKSKKLAAGLSELERINAAPAYMILLYLFSLPENHIENPQFLEQVVSFLCKYFVRRNVTDTPPTREIDQAFIDVIEDCARRTSARKPVQFDWFVKLVMKHARPASIDQFCDVLSGNIYAHNGAMARYVLIQLDEQQHSREYKPDLWNRDEKGRYIWTVEHVLPQTEKLPPAWVQMLAEGDRQRALELQDEWVHKLGNLTLSGFNSDLAISPFEKKQKLAKDRSFLGHKINIGYQNGLYLNSLEFKVGKERYSLATAPCWNEEMIQARTAKLVELVVKANLLPGEGN